MNKQSIVFAHYKGDKLLGYRQDTFGTLGLDWAKVYGAYSKEQVDTVLDNIADALESDGKTGAILGIPELSAGEAAIRKSMVDARAFEVRVIAFPVSAFEKELNVETGEWEENYVGILKEDVDKFIASPEEHVVLETHYFTFDGQINLQ